MRGKLTVMSMLLRQISSISSSVLVKALRPQKLYFLKQLCKQGSLVSTAGG